MSPELCGKSIAYNKSAAMGAEKAKDLDMSGSAILKPLPVR